MVIPGYARLVEQKLGKTQLVSSRGFVITENKSLPEHSSTDDNSAFYHKPSQRACVLSDKRRELKNNEGGPPQSSPCLCSRPNFDSIAMPPPPAFPKTSKKMITKRGDLKEQVLYSSLNSQPGTERNVEKPPPASPEENFADVRVLVEGEESFVKPSISPVDTKSHSTQQLFAPNSTAWVGYRLERERTRNTTNCPRDVESGGKGDVLIRPTAARPSCRSSAAISDAFWVAFLCVAVAATCNAVSSVLMLIGTGQLWPRITAFPVRSQPREDAESRPLDKFVPLLPYWVIFMTTIHLTACLLRFAHLHTRITWLRDTAVVISVFCVVMTSQQLAAQAFYTFQPSIPRGWCWQMASLTFLTTSTVFHIIAVLFVGSHSLSPSTENRQLQFQHLDSCSLFSGNGSSAAATEAPSSTAYRSRNGNPCRGFFHY